MSKDIRGITKLDIGLAIMAALVIIGLFVGLLTGKFDTKIYEPIDFDEKTSTLVWLYYNCPRDEYFAEYLTKDSSMTGSIQISKSEFDSLYKAIQEAIPVDTLKNHKVEIVGIFKK